MIGRFTQEDTYYGDGLNLYQYCANNPVRYKDPSGHGKVEQDPYKRYTDTNTDAETAALASEVYPDLSSKLDLVKKYRSMGYNAENALMLANYEIIHGKEMAENFANNSVPKGSQGQKSKKSKTSTPPPSSNTKNTKAGNNKNNSNSSGSNKSSASTGPQKIHRGETMKMDLQFFAADESSSNFRNQDLLDSHYDKHGSEFGNISKEQYLQGANELINSTSDDILKKTRVNGDIIYYNSRTNEFAVRSADGYIRTYFKPSDGLDYFNRQ